MLGQRDRSLVAEAIFSALRHYGTLQWQMQPAHPARAPRLAALVTLARQHGFDALDPRTLRSAMRARSRSRTATDSAAPAAVRAEVPLWLFRRVTAQYHDAAPLFAALSSAAPLDLRVNTLKATRDDVLDELRGTSRQQRLSDAATRRTRCGCSTSPD